MKRISQLNITLSKEMRRYANVYIDKQLNSPYQCKFRPHILHAKQNKLLNISNKNNTNKRMLRNTYYNKPKMQFYLFYNNHTLDVLYT